MAYRDSGREMILLLKVLVLCWILKIYILLCVERAVAHFVAVRVYIATTLHTVILIHYTISYIFFGSIFFGLTSFCLAHRRVLFFNRECVCVCIFLTSSIIVYRFYMILHTLLNFICLPTLSLAPPLSRSICIFLAHTKTHTRAHKCELVDQIHIASERV